jgi:predicted ArsR family transcriptional regulator
MARYRYSHQQFAAELAEVAETAARALERQGDHEAAANMRRDGAQWIAPTWEEMEEELDQASRNNLLRRLLGL